MFHFQYVCGKGGFGRVWKIELRKQKTFYALKEMSKARIISKRSVNSVMNEKRFLSELNHS
jgi:serine/threonine protein kinase